MNERIEELAGQCRIETYGVNGELLEFGFDEEKFAELIVRECVHTVENRGGMCGALSSNWIKEHFGVEE